MHAFPTELRRRVRKAFRARNLHHFFDYRKGWAPMTFDAFAAIRGAKGKERWGAAGFAIALLVAPALPVLLGSTQLAEIGEGSRWFDLSLGMSLLVWPVILESPGRSSRRRGQTESVFELTPAPTNERTGKAAFWVLTLFELAAVAVVVFAWTAVDISILRGALWGIALAGTADIVASLLTIVLCNREGVPLGYEGVITRRERRARAAAARAAK